MLHFFVHNRKCVHTTGNTLFSLGKDATVLSSQTPPSNVRICNLVRSFILNGIYFGF